MGNSNDKMHSKRGNRSIPEAMKKLYSHYDECYMCHSHSESGVCPAMAQEWDDIKRELFRSDRERKDASFIILRNLLYNWQYKEEPLGSEASYDLAKLIIDDAESLPLCGKECHAMVCARIEKLLQIRDNINIRKLYVANMETESLVELLPNLQHLRTVELRNVSVTNHLYKTIAHCCPFLETLKVFLTVADAEVGVPDKGVHPFLVDLKGNSLFYTEYASTKRVILGWRLMKGRIGDDEDRKECFYSSFVSVQSLHEMFPSWMPIINEIFWNHNTKGSLGTALSRFQNLSVLSISYCNQKKLKDLLKEKRKLLSLTIDGDDLTLELAQLFAKLPLLERLRISAGITSRITLKGTTNLSNIRTLSLLGSCSYDVPLSDLANDASSLEILELTDGVDLTYEELDEFLGSKESLKEFSVERVPGIELNEQKTLFDKYSSQVRRIGGYIRLKSKEETDKANVAFTDYRDCRNFLTRHEWKCSICRSRRGTADAALLCRELLSVRETARCLLDSQGWQSLLSEKTAISKYALEDAFKIAFAEIGFRHLWAVQTENTLSGFMRYLYALNTPTIDSVDSNHLPALEEESTNSSELDDVEYYRMEHKNAGVCVIIDNLKFDDNKHPTRYGSEIDELALTETFIEFGYTVLTRVNQTSAEIIQGLDEVRDDYFGSSSKKCSVVVCILSHGDKEVVYGSDNRPVQKEAIYDIFSNSNCRGLIGKPRLYIFQACQGTQPLASVIVCTDSIGPIARRGRRPQTVPQTSDYLILNSTISGYVSVRDKEEGSPFIRLLCDQLEQRGPITDIQRVITHVNAIITRKTYLIEPDDLPETNPAHQEPPKDRELLRVSTVMPETISTLTKLLKFKTN